MSDNSKRDNLFVEVPPTPHYPYPERIPSATDPMGEIQIRGRALGTLGRGNVRWWVIIAGWLIFGLPLLFVAISILFANAFDLIILLPFLAIPMFPLWRGTARKLARK